MDVPMVIIFLKMGVSGVPIVPPPHALEKLKKKNKQPHTT